MNKLEIILERDNGKFKPGDTIAGEVRIESLEAETEQMEINFLWFTQGKGDKDHEVIVSELVESLAPNSIHKFKFSAPSYPGSCSGKLVSIIWAIEAVLFPKLNSLRKEIVISPDGNERIMSNIRFEPVS